MAGKSIFDKLWDLHVITGEEGQPQLMYVDQHYIHEVTSPQAFQGLRDAGRRLRRPDLTFGTFDHNVPTVNIYDHLHSCVVVLVLGWQVLPFITRLENGILKRFGS